MLYFHFIEEALGAQGVKVKKDEIDGNTHRIWLEMPRKEQICPCCKARTEKVHDYREQKIKGGEANQRYIEIHYRKRRYVCCKCGKRFAEENSFVGRYKRMTMKMILTVMEMVKGTRSFSDVAKTMNISVQTVIRLFDLKSLPKPKELPAVLSIDEFRGNTNGEKFQVSLTDPANHDVLDILPRRTESYLTRYFLAIPKKERDKMQFFVSDMYKPYARIAAACFPNAIHVVDRFHWVRQFFWAFENIRKREQKRFSKSYRLYFKRSRKLLMRRLNTLSGDDVQQVMNICYLSSDLDTAYVYKEILQKILDSEDSPDVKKEAFMKMTNGMKESGIPELEKCADTYYNWSSGILASFDYTYSNGFTEGFNNKI